MRNLLKYIIYCIKIYFNNLNVIKTYKQKYNAMIQALYESNNYNKDIFKINDDVYIITLNGAILKTKFNPEIHNTYLKWGNCFHNEDEAQIKSIRIQQYLKSEIDFESLIYILKYNISTMKKLEDKDKIINMLNEIR